MNTIKKNWPFVLIILVYVLYAGIYIYKTSFVADGERYFVLFDDAMISMRYAKNLAEGYGLVWNPGELPVEGYTNPLWVVFMAIFHLLPIPIAKMSLPIQISGAIFLTANLVYVKKIAASLSTNIIVPVLAMILTAFYMPLNNWGLQGMEVSILTLITSVALWMTIQCLRNNRFSPWIYVLLGVGTLVRIDMAVPYLVIFGYLFIADSKNRKNNFVWGLGLLAAFILSQTLFRFWYYGDVLPNTYYLKMEGFPLLLRIKRGLYVFSEFAVQMNWVLFLLPFSLLAFRRNRVTLLLALIILGQIAYSIYVGGDAWEHQGGSNRYISIGIPIFFILFTYSTEQIFRAIASHTNALAPSKQILINLGIALFVLASMYNFNFTLRTARRTIETWILKRQPIFVEGNKEDLRIALALKQITTPEAHLAVVTAGVIPYFSTRPAIDLLGKNDPIIAHRPSHIPPALADIRPGHMKWDYDYSIGQLKPDIIVQLWGDSQPAEKYIEQYYTVVEVDGMLFSILSDSANILWDRVQIQP
ncbi:MAG: hypothetical protein KKD28_10580 [Chloroflexi bacterium]|nr:hypothetical protein [Chloroflexota bacterium]